MFEKALLRTKLVVTVVTGVVTLAYTVKWCKELDDAFHGRSRSKQKKSDKRNRNEEIVVEFID